MKKIVIVTLKVLAVVTLISGIFAAFATSTMSMRGMMRYFVEPSFNITIFITLLITGVLSSVLLYGFAIHLETQEEMLDEIKRIHFRVRAIDEENDFENCEECDEIIEEVDVESEPTQEEIIEVQETDTK
ncbi:hypothetical protein [Anaerorhabdus sp.]|jgi:hypothetical protein|uniref:hypothetical protein n=1 Tax=Anaerorhabdus sp. TaxID=1872524 RepID=UPI002B1F28D2|nr:hypothetical protein [Anaerorhabdus sp.]MEA4874033.1 hypothetical protein [Anaerorhabdus sp.]